MVKKIYKEAFDVLSKKPFRLWGISLLCMVLTGVFSVLFGFVLIAAIASVLLLSTGMTMVFLHGFRGEQVYAVQLFDCFKDWATIKRVLCGFGWMVMWLFLWALIPIAGPFIMIYKLYAWRLVPYILVQEPEIAPTEAIHVSRSRTMGYKGKMFCADLIPTGCFALLSLACSLLSFIPVVGILFSILLVVVSIAWLLVGPLFLGIVKAGFYEEINQNIQTPEMKFCPNCGEKHVVGIHHCPNCGTALD